MIFLFVNDNKVVDKKEMSEDDASLVAHHYQQVVPVDGLPREPMVGWIYDKGVFYPDIKAVTPRQIRQALILMGHPLSEIDNAINALPEPSRSLASVEWEYSTLVFRTNKLVGMLGHMQGWTEQQLDDLWIFAGKL